MQLDRDSPKKSHFDLRYFQKKNNLKVVNNLTLFETFPWANDVFERMTL